MLLISYLQETFLNQNHFYFFRSLIIKSAESILIMCLKTILWFCYMDNWHIVRKNYRNCCKVFQLYPVIPFFQLNDYLIKQPTYTFIENGLYDKTCIDLLCQPNIVFYTLLQRDPQLHSSGLYEYKHNIMYHTTCWKKLK